MSYPNISNLQLKKLPRALRQGEVSKNFLDYKALT